MKIATGNKLAHYQAEYNELMEQLKMLEARVPYIQGDIKVLQCYLSLNQGDTSARSDYQRDCSILKHINAQIIQKQRRLSTLTGQIQYEQNKAMYGSNARSTNRYKRLG